jgi:hypothetical protein
MSTLTYAGRHPAATHPGAERRRFWGRLFDSIIAARQRRAEREVARYLATRGGILSDEDEREIMRRLSGDTRRSV